MCRNIKPLFNFDPPASEQEVHDAALQFVRKIAGTTKPNHTNEAAFYQGVDEIARAAQHLLASLKTSTTPRNRAIEAARQRAKNARRFANEASGGLSATQETA